jgi:hypothetical protein
MCASRSDVFRREKPRGGVEQFSSDGEKICVTTNFVLLEADFLYFV